MSLTPAERMMVDSLSRQVRELSSRLSRLSGTGVSSNSRAGNIRTMQIGFPAELTSTYNSTTGYSWKELQLDTTVPSIAAVTKPKTGNKAFALDSDTSLASGTQVWLEPDQKNSGYVIVGSASVGESPGSTLCSSRGWWWKVRDTDTSFRAQVTNVTGACTCVDDTFDATLTAAGTRNNFTNTTDFLDICGVDYAVALIPPGITVGGAIQYAPRLQLTEQGSSSPTVISISATCFGDGWAEFTGPGYDRYNVCTDTEETGCDGDNGFTIRVDCVCQSSNYNGPGWYVVANGSTAFTPSVAYNLQSPPACTVKLCPGGPYATEAAAYAATCFIAGPDSGASAETPIVSCLGTLIAPVDAEVEFYDGTGDATFLNGYVADISYPDSTGAGSLWGNTLSDIPDFMGGGSGGNINVFCAPDGSTPETFRLRLNNGAGSPGWGVDLTISTTPNQTSITGNGWDIEIVFANVPFYSPRDSVQTGTISAVLRRRSA